MAKRTLEELHIKGEDYIFAGDLEIAGNVTIENASLIVSGSIIFSEDESIHPKRSIHIMNGDISANEITGSIDITNEVGDIYCHDVLSVCDINISGGDINVGELDVYDVTSDGDIIVNNDSSTDNVSCCNYLVAGYNTSDVITASEDIYILGDNHSCDLSARDIFLDGEDIDLRGCNIVASRALEAKPITNCSSIKVGR